MVNASRRRRRGFRTKGEEKKQKTRTTDQIHHHYLLLHYQHHTHRHSSRSQTPNLPLLLIVYRSAFLTLHLLFLFFSFSWVLDLCSLARSSWWIRVSVAIWVLGFCKVRILSLDFVFGDFFCLVVIWGWRNMPEEEVVELKFRLVDGSDIGPVSYSSALTIATLKERIVSDWPKDKKIIPKAANDIKLICSGKILENSQTLAQCRTPFSDISGGVTTVHVLVQPSFTKTKAEKKVDNPPKKAPACSCSIM